MKRVGVVKRNSRWLYTPLGAVAVAAMAAFSFVLGYVLHPV